jgi:diguanylate cyclase (GGDEF)-like protein
MLASYAAIALDNAALFKSIEHLAAVDSLTGIYNRRKLFELGRSEYHRARRFHRPLSILMFDIDHFKRVNDTFGHSVGDLVLSQFAHLLKAGIRDIDILGRYGGEEFLIILPETRKTTAVSIANRLRAQIAATFQNMYDGSISLTASIGVAAMKDDTHSFTGLMKKLTMLYMVRKIWAEIGLSLRN